MQLRGVAAAFSAFNFQIRYCHGWTAYVDCVQNISYYDFRPSSNRQRSVGGSRFSTMVSVQQLQLSISSKWFHKARLASAIKTWKLRRALHTERICKQNVLV